MVTISILIFIVALALPSLNKSLSPIINLRLSAIILIYAGALSLNALYIQSIGSGIGIYSGLFQVTVVSQSLDTFLLILASLILIPYPTNLLIIKTSSSIQSLALRLQSSKLINKLNSNIKNLKIEHSELPSTQLGGKYALIILFSSLGSLLLMSSSDLLSMYLSIELQSFGLYILSTLFRDSKSATSAGLKYFLLGGLSSSLILLGSGLVYTFTGLTNLESIFSLISVSDSQSILQGCTLGFFIITVGFLFKIAAAPLHNWAPDVYDDSPTIVTIWLTIIPKISILIFLFEVIIGGIGYNITSNTLNISETLFTNIQMSEILKTLLLLSSLISLIIGTVVGLAQTKIKRLLAYSTISHIGFILLGLAINTEQSIESFIFYIIQYSITNLNTFLIILALGYLINYSLSSKSSLLKLNNSTNPAGVIPLSKDIISSNEPHVINYSTEGAYTDQDKDIKFINEFKGQFTFNPLLAISFTICLFSMAGVPPLIGFFSKQMVLYSAVQSGYYFMAIVAIIVSVISASYYLKIVRVLFTEPENTEIQSSTSSTSSEALIESNVYYLNNLTESTSENIISQSKINNFHSFLISVLTLTILLFILKPSIFLNSIQLLCLSLYNC